MSGKKCEREVEEAREQSVEYVSEEETKRGQLRMCKMIDGGCEACCC